MSLTLQREHASENQVAALLPFHFDASYFNNLCHEIRTPLNAILGLANILASATPSPERQKACAGMLRDSSQMLLELLNDLLDCSKLDSSKIELEHIPFDLAKVVQEAKNIIQVKAEQKNLKIHIRTREGMPPTYLGDPRRIRQILLNLLSNAVKFTDHGRISIYMTESAVVDGYSKISITVADSGMGMDSEQMKKIFGRYTQGNSSISRNYGGTGLGLFISQELAHLMNGNITVKSWPHMGSHFTVTLRLQKAP